MDPKQTALVLIEYQHDFTSEGGALHAAVKDVMERTNMLANTAATVAAARDAGVLIVHAPITFAPGYPELSPRAYGILKGARDAGAFQKGSWGAEIVEDVAPQAGDIVIEGKRGLDAFATTNLDFILRMRGIVNVALGGFLTNCCVESTMRTAYELGYNVVTLTDCTAAASEAEHQAAITSDYPMFSHPMTHTDFLAMLGHTAEAAESSRSDTRAGP
jgi:nicotinamidase-related amidase